MILDIIVIAVLTMPAALGLYRGFAHAFVCTLGWLAALAGGILLASPVSGILKSTFVEDMIFDRLSDKFAESSQALEAAFESLPRIISGGLAVTAGESAEIFAELLTSVLVTIISFLITFLLIRLALGIAVRSMRKKEKFSLLKGANKMLGLAAGLIEGAALVFVFLALLVPLGDLADPAMSAAIAEELESSAIAGTLYDNNLLLLMTGGLFS